MAVDLEEALIAWLRTKEAVVLNLDKDTNDTPHIYSDVLPQSAKPAPGETKTQIRALVLHEISGSHAEHLRGTSTLAWKRIQFDCHGPTPKKARQLRYAVKEAIVTLQDRAVLGGVRICGAEHGGDYSTSTAPADGSPQYRHTRSVDYHFSFQNA